MTDQVKTCNKCLLVKPIDNFSKNRSKRDGLHPQCKECMKTYLKAHYNNNKQYYRDKARKYETTVFNVISSLKANTPCADCNKYYDPICMDFDHLDGSLKEYGIANAMSQLGYSIIKILKEVEKCEIVCSNCHRIRTRDRRLLGCGTAATAVDFDSTLTKVRVLPSQPF